MWYDITMAVAEDIRREFLALYDRETNSLFRHVFLRCRDRERSKDIVQEAFCRVWSSLARGAAIEQPRAFLYRVARNVMIDMARKKREALFAESDDADLFEDHAMTGKAEEDAEYGRALEAIATLSREYREAFTMRFVDDFSPKEIAEILGVSANVVSVRITRAAKELRKRLGVDHAQAVTTTL